MREEIENNHQSYFDKASDLAARIGSEISAPRRCGRQRHRGNVPATTAIEYYRREVTVPFIDHLIGELNNRFFNGQEIIVPKASSLIPAQVIAKDNWRIMAREFMREYGADMPAPLSFRAEMDLWETHWKIQAQSGDGIPTDATETLRMMESTFPNIYNCLLISVTMPVTSCECERSVSVLRRLKTYKRSTMTNQRLTVLP